MNMLMLHVVATFLLTGLIWTIQVVHYPLMARVSENSFIEYHAAHSRRISFLVIPLMLTELVTGVWLVAVPQPLLPQAWAVTGLALIAVVWASTFFLQVPPHRKLSAGFDATAHRRLVSSNWIRTLAWTVRSLLLVVALSVQV